jgi:hypothetical protein
MHAARSASTAQLHVTYPAGSTSGNHAFPSLLVALRNADLVPTATEPWAVLYTAADRAAAAAAITVAGELKRW